VLAAIHGISIFLAVIACIILAGWVIERIGLDLKGGRRRRGRRGR
jgi:hypothetical protein